MLRRLGTLPVLAVSGTVMAVMHGAIYIFFLPATGGTLLDFALTGQTAADALAALKARPNAVGIHLYLSAGVDMVYAAAYGIFVAGLCFRYGGAGGGWFALPIASAALCDLAENTVQVIALAGDPDVLWLKGLLTPAKFALAAIGSALAIWLWARTTFGRRPLDPFFHFPGSPKPGKDRAKSL
ncbi:MAG: hypothetical protein AAGH87_10745 [Pseudomonadota bacterium]